MFEGLDFWFEQIIAYCIAFVLVQFMQNKYNGKYFSHFRRGMI